MNEESSSSLVVVLNSKKELEYFRNRQLNEKQIQDLNIIDSQLTQGFKIDGQLISSPTQQDKATYIANLLVSALINNDELKMALCCSYLATRYATLKQIRATTQEGHYTIRLIYDQNFVEESSVQFMNKKDLN